MGYYTDYTLSVHSAKRDAAGAVMISDEIPSDLERQIENEIGKMNVFQDGNVQDAYYANAKWYDHEDDMRLLSAKFPDVVFWLSGSGDDCDDLWQKFFVGGRMQTCYAQIVYDDFDPSKLDDESVPDIADGIYSYQA